MRRLPGPQCTSSAGEDWIDRGTLSLGKASAPQPVGGDELSPEERELILDLTQFVFDMAGFVDPTPISDGTSAAISIARGDWFGAGLSGIALIPFVGDLAKVGKLGRWAKTVHKAIVVARRNKRFADFVRPILRKISNALDQVPTSLLPKSAQATLKKMKTDLDSFLGASTKVASRTITIQRYLVKWFKYIDELEMVAPPRNSGALWSKLGAVAKGGEGAAMAQRLAKAENKVTLEMTLQQSKFKERYDLAVEQLKEQLGSGDRLWEDFGKAVWTRVSEKYARLLEGRVVAYTKLEGGGGVMSAITKGDEPILVDELWELADIIQKSPSVTSVEVVDVVTGMRRTMMREDVLRSTRLSH